MGTKVLDFFGFRCPAAPSGVHVLNPQHWFDMWDRASSLGLFAGIFLGAVGTLVLVGLLIACAWFVSTLVRGSR